MSSSIDRAKKKSPVSTKKDRNEGESDGWKEEGKTDRKSTEEVKVFLIKKLIVFLVKFLEKEVIYSQASAWFTAILTF